MSRKKYLFGTSHGSDSELDSIMSKISELSPRRIGLELPENYRSKMQSNISVSFMGDLYSFAKSRRTRVVLLESPALWERGRAICYARKTLERSHTSCMLNDKIDALVERMHFTAPEVQNELNWKLDLYQAALSILEQHPTIDALIEPWNGINREREMYMLKRIVAKKPDVIVVGTAHADRLRAELSHYTYESFSN